MLKGEIHVGVARVKQLEQQLGASLLENVLQYFSTDGIESDIKYLFLFLEKNKLIKIDIVKKRIIAKAFSLKIPL